MTEQKTMNQSLFEALMEEFVPQITTAGGKYSVSIVNNVNGKRVTLSKALAEHLELSDSVSVMPSAKSHKLVLGKALPFPGASKVNLSGTSKKIAYNADLVQIITKAYNLDFTSCTSRSFSDITFDVLEGVPIAFVNFPVTEREEAAS